MEIVVACRDCGGALSAKAGAAGKGAGIRLEVSGCGGCAAEAGAHVRTELERLVARLGKGDGMAIVEKARRPSEAVAEPGKRCACGASIASRSSACRKCATRKSAAKRRAGAGGGNGGSSCLCGCGEPAMAGRVYAYGHKPTGATRERGPGSAPPSPRATAGAEACELCHLVTKVEGMPCAKGHPHAICPTCRGAGGRVRLSAAGKTLELVECPGRPAAGRKRRKAGVPA